MGLGALTDGLAPTPPMGWNSWNRFGPFVSDQLVRETADALIESGRRDAGYRYVVIDDAWEGSLRSDDGQLEPNLWRFPSMRRLAAYLHERDLRFGLYTCASAGHLWRTAHDIADRWDSLIDVLDRQADLADFAGPDHWNDPDMLEVGNGGVTEAENRAHVSLWAIPAAPLMA